MKLWCEEACGGTVSFHTLRFLAITYLPFLEKRAYTKFMGTLECRTVTWELMLLLAVFEETELDFIVGFGGWGFVLVWHNRNGKMRGGRESLIPLLFREDLEQNLSTPVTLVYVWLAYSSPVAIWCSWTVSSLKYTAEVWKCKPKFVTVRIYIHFTYLYLHLLIPVTVMQLLVSGNDSMCYTFMVRGWCCTFP